MAEYDMSNATNTDLKGTVEDYSVDHSTPDQTSDHQKETYYDYPDSAEYLGYYKTIPELKKAIDALATWTVGKGLKSDNSTKVKIEGLRGWGEDSFQSILWNLQVQKKVFGDAFAEIIRNENGTLINIKPLYPGNMRVVVNGEGMITRYEHRTRGKNGKAEPFKPEEILHLVNDRIANEIHGVSAIEACKWVIDARNEAMDDWKRISHRSTIRVMYIDESDEATLDRVNSEYATAIKNGELLVIPAKKGDVDFEDLQLPPVEAFMRWIQYLENFFYQAVGVPRVIANPEGTEASSKVGYLTFEPIYTKEQTDLEADLWAQVAIKVKFNRPPSLSGVMQQDEEKNTGQTGFQPNDVEASIERE